MSIPTVAPKSAHTATVIFLHGLGDTGHGWSYALRDIAEPYIKYMCPSAPMQKVTLNAGMTMPSWFDIVSLDGSGPEDEAGVKASAVKLAQLIDGEVQKGVPAERIVIGGFSQGGAVALYTALTCGKKLAGVIGLSCFLPLHKHFPAALTSNQDTPIFLGHGSQDPLVHLSLGQLTYEYVKQMNPQTTFITYPGMGHSSCEKEMTDVRNFIRKVLPKPS